MNERGEGSEWVLPVFSYSESLRAAWQLQTYTQTRYFVRFPYRTESSKPSISNFSTKLRMVA